jgi:tripartite-type tricarboxylate transporter receptor subunit TctC
MRCASSWKVSGFTALVAALGLLHIGQVNAQTSTEPYPSKPITLIVPYTTGTTADTLSRLLGQKLAEQWKVAVITDNRAGAAGAIGTEAAAKAAPNGYTLMFTATAHATLPAFRPKLPFDPIKSFTPVVLLGTSAMCLVVSPKIESRTVKEFIDLAKSQPGKMDYSSPGAGGPQHMAMESSCRRPARSSCTCRTRARPAR